MEIRNETQKEVAYRSPVFIRSLFIQDCIQRRSMQSESGARYNHGMVDVYGIANVVDSLYAIKKFVYTRQIITLPEFAAILRQNFEGNHEFLLKCKKLPKYGNEISEVDELGKKVFDHVFAYIRTKQLWKGGCYYGFCASAPGNHIGFGHTTGATPDGRLAGMPLASSVGPSSGNDTSGPTAMLKSASTPDLSLAIGTPVLNLSLSPEYLKPDNRNILISLIKTYFMMGGMQLQLNLTDAVTLKEAQKNPEQHKNLIVRVAGYSARFVDLNSDIQNDLIQRTVHSV